MPDDNNNDNTPTPSNTNQILWERVSVLKRDMRRLKDSVVEHDRILIEAFGRSGKDGIMAEVKALRKFQLRVMFYALGGASAGGGLFQAILQLLN